MKKRSADKASDNKPPSANVAKNASKTPQLPLTLSSSSLSLLLLAKSPAGRRESVSDQLQLKTLSLSSLISSALSLAKSPGEGKEHVGELPQSEVPRMGTQKSPAPQEPLPSSSLSSLSLSKSPEGGENLLKNRRN